MLKIFLFLILCLNAALLYAGGALRIADASRSGVQALNAAAFKLAVTQKTAVSIEKVTPEEAKKRLTAGRADLIILEHGNLPQKNSGICRLFAAEVLGVYVHPDNPVRDLRRKDLREILTDPRPGWKAYSPLKQTDIHRFGLNERASGSGLAESLLRVEHFAPEIFKTGSTAEVLLLVQNDPESLGYALFLPETPSQVKVLSIHGVMPVPDSVKNGKYLLSWRYYILAPEKPSRTAEAFLKLMETREFLKELEKARFMVL